MITLHQYPPAFGLPSLSPFCIKVEFYLKIARIPYRVVWVRNPKAGPKGKMPFIEVEGVQVADSSFILRHIAKDDFEILDPIKKSQAMALKILIEEGLYFVLLYSRWIDKDGFKIIKKHFSQLFPIGLGSLFLFYIRRSLHKQGIAQGIARHQKDEVYGIGRDYVSTISALLGDSEYFFEDRLTSFDATAYAFLSTIMKQPIESPLKEHLLRCSNLVSYVQRLDRIWSSY